MNRALTLVGVLVLMGLIAWVHGRMTGTAGDHSPRQRARLDIKWLGAQIETFAMDTGRYPSTLDELVRDTGVKGRLGPYSRVEQFEDPWDRPFRYRRDESGKSFRLLSLGKDGVVGGWGQAADIDYEPNEDLR